MWVDSKSHLLRFYDLCIETSPQVKVRLSHLRGAKETLSGGRLHPGHPSQGERPANRALCRSLTFLTGRSPWLPQTSPPTTCFTRVSRVLLPPSNPLPTGAAPEAPGPAAPPATGPGFQPLQSLRPTVRPPSHPLGGPPSRPPRGDRGPGGFSAPGRLSRTF